MVFHNNVVDHNNTDYHPRMPLIINTHVQCVFMVKLWYYKLPGARCPQPSSSWSSPSTLIGRNPSQYVLFIPSLVRVRRPCRGLEKFFPPVLQRCYGCSFHAQEIVHTGHGMLGYNCFFVFFLLERKVPAQSKLKE